MVVRTDERLVSRLKELATLRGYSLRRLSKEMGLAQSTLSQVANGKRTAAPATLVALCDKLDCTPGDLMFVEPALK